MEKAFDIQKTVKFETNFGNKIKKLNPNNLKKNKTKKLRKLLWKESRNLLFVTFAN